MEKKSRPSDFVGMTGETKVRRFMEKYGYLCAINAANTVVKVEFNQDVTDATDVTATQFISMTEEQEIADGAQATDVTFSDDGNMSTAEVTFGAAFDDYTTYSLAFVEYPEGYEDDQDRAELLAPVYTGIFGASEYLVLQDVSMNEDNTAVEVSFNEDLADTAVDAAHYTIADGDGGTETPAASFKTIDSEEDKSVVVLDITGGTLDVDTNYELTVNDKAKVVAESGNKIEDFEGSMFFNTPVAADVTPAITDVEIGSYTKMLITFDRPVVGLNNSDLSPEITVTDMDENVISAATTNADSYDVETAGDDSDQVVLTFAASSFEPGESYLLNIDADTFTDSVFTSELNAAVEEMQVDIEPDTAPSFVEANIVRDEDDTSLANLEIVFDRTIHAGDGTGNITLEGSGNSGNVDANSVVTIEDNKAIIKNVEDKFFAIEDGVTYDLEVAADAILVNFDKATPYQVFAIDRGNELIETTVEGIDLRAPVAEELAFNADGTISVTFDKAIDAD
jgi:hypothetical protein